MEELCGDDNISYVYLDSIDTSTWMLFTCLLSRLLLGLVIMFTVAMIYSRTWGGKIRMFRPTDPDKKVNLLLVL